MKTIKLYGTINGTEITVTFQLVLLTSGVYAGNYMWKYTCNNYTKYYDDSISPIKMGEKLFDTIYTINDRPYNSDITYLNYFENAEILKAVKFLGL